MATDVERLVVSLEASITKYERAMNKALGQTNTTTRRIESRFDAMNRRVSSGFVGLQRGIAMAFAGVAATRGVQSLIDSSTRLENALKVTGLAGEELEAVYQKLYASAQRNLAPVDTLVDLYSRLGLAASELGVTTDQMTAFTDRVALALRVQGTSATEARGALVQLSQAMGEGIFRAQEFNSIIEQAPSIHRAAAAGLEEAGGSVAKLRQLMLDGKLSSRAYFDALLAGSHILEDQVANAELTVSQGFVRLRNVLIDVARDMNEGSRVSGVLVEGLEDLGNVITQVADFANYAVEPISNFIGVLQSGQSAAVGFANALAQITGLENIGASAAKVINDLEIPGLSAGSSAGGRVVSNTFELLGATPQDEALAALLTGDQEATTPTQITVKANPKTVSLADYTVPGSDDDSTGGSKKTPAQNFQEELDRRERAIEMLNMETELRRGLNPLIEDHGYAVEKLTALMELENAAKEAGIELGPEQRQDMERLAEGYALATANAARLAEEQDRVREAAEAMGAAGREALETIIDGFIEGKDAGEIFASVLKGLGSALINMGLNSLGTQFKIPGFANGTVSAPGGMALVGERGPELVNLPQGAQVIPNYRTNQMIGGNAPSITYAPQIDARGADIAAVARLEQVMANDRAQFEGRVKAVVKGRGHKWR